MGNIEIAICYKSGVWGHFIALIVYLTCSVSNFQRKSSNSKFGSLVTATPNQNENAKTTAPSNFDAEAFGDMFSTLHCVPGELRLF